MSSKNSQAAFPPPHEPDAAEKIGSKSNFWPFLGSRPFSGIFTLTLFCQTKSVEKERERKEGKEERKEKGEVGEARKEGEREEAVQYIWF